MITYIAVVKNTSWKMTRAKRTDMFGFMPYESSSVDDHKFCKVI